MSVKRKASVLRFSGRKWEARDRKTVKSHESKARARFLRRSSRDNPGGWGIFILRLCLLDLDQTQSAVCMLEDSLLTFGQRIARQGTRADVDAPKIQTIFAIGLYTAVAVDDQG